ncbi:MAG: hypothetical protein AAGC71_18070 [Pseudomonadota bacterium]
MQRRTFLGAMGAGLWLPHNTVFGADRPPKVLVLGGTGYFGPVLVQEMLRQGIAVTLFNRGKTNPHLFPDVPKIRGDRMVANAAGLAVLQRSRESWDWVVDTWQGSSKCVSDTATLLKPRTTQYQYVSTVSVYDKWDTSGITEDAELNPLPADSEPLDSPYRYALRKTFSERVLQQQLPSSHAAFRSHGMRGYPTSKPIHEPYWQVKIMRGRHLVVPEGIGHYQVTDMLSLAKFMIHCGRQGHMGAYNVAYSPFLFRDFIDRLVAHLSSDVTLHWIPQQFLLAKDIRLMRNTPPGRYRFSVTKALTDGLINRSIEVLCDDQLRGYRDRHPDDDFTFGQPGTSLLSEDAERTVIEQWSRASATTTG